MRLKDKVSIVTGAANGIGEATARLFAQEGSAVVLCDIDEARGRLVAEEICTSGGQASFIKADVSRAECWKEVLEHTLTTHGQLDILVNNAGVSGRSAPIDDRNAWERMTSVNAKSVYIGCSLAAEIMKQAGRGSIVNISSIFGMVGGDTSHPAYHASKAAVRNLSKAFAVRLAPHNVRVNSIFPGYMVPMTSAVGSIADRASKCPMGRVGQPIEVAYGILFLGSDEASFITGADLAIDGGFLAR